MLAFFLLTKFILEKLKKKVFFLKKSNVLIVKNLLKKNFLKGSKSIKIPKLKLNNVIILIKYNVNISCLELGLHQWHLDFQSNALLLSYLNRLIFF